MCVCPSVRLSTQAAAPQKRPQAQPQAAGAAAGRRAAGARRPTGRPCLGTVEAY